MPKFNARHAHQTPMNVTPHVANLAVAIAAAVNVAMLAVIVGSFVAMTELEITGRAVRQEPQAMQERATYAQIAGIWSQLGDAAELETPYVWDRSGLPLLQSETRSAAWLEAAEAVDVTP